MSQRSQYSFARLITMGPVVKRTWYHRLLVFRCINLHNRYRTLSPWVRVRTDHPHFNHIRETYHKIKTVKKNLHVVKMGS